jgi:hypothetical protein
MACLVPVDVAFHEVAPRIRSALLGVRTLNEGGKEVHEPYLPPLAPFPPELRLNRLQIPGLDLRRPGIDHDRQLPAVPLEKACQSVHGCFHACQSGFSVPEIRAPIERPARDLRSLPIMSRLPVPEVVNRIEHPEHEDGVLPQRAFRPLPQRHGGGRFFLMKSEIAVLVEAVVHRLVPRIRDVEDDDHLVEVQTQLLDQVLRLPPMDAGRVRRDAGIEHLDSALRKSGIEQADEGPLVRKTDPFREGVTHEEQAPRIGRERHSACRPVLKAERVRA